MAVLDATDSAVAPGVVTIASAQAGNGATTNYADRGSAHKRGGTMVRVVAGTGAGPTCTYQIEVSLDASTWDDATYADISDLDTDSTATFAIVADSVVSKVLKHPDSWRYVRVTMSANTNVTNTVDVWFNDNKSFLTA